MQKGIKESKEAIVFLGQFASVTGDVTADGKVSLVELLKFAQLWPVIAPAVDGYKEMPAEFSDLDSMERAELNDAFAGSLKLPAEKTEVILEDGFDLALHITQFIVKVRELRAAEKAA